MSHPAMANGYKKTGGAPSRGAACPQVRPRLKGSQEWEPAMQSFASHSTGERLEVVPP